MGIFFEHITKWGKDKVESYPQLKITIPISSVFISLFGWITLFPSSFYQSYYFLLFSIREYALFIFIISALLILISVKIKHPSVSIPLMILGIVGSALCLLKFNPVNRFSEPKIGIITSNSTSPIASKFEKYVFENLSHRQDIDLRIIKYYYNSDNIQEAVSNMKKAKNDNLDILLIESYLPISDLNDSQLKDLINPYTLYLTTKPFKKEIVGKYENIIAVSPKLTSELYEVTKKLNIESDTIYYISNNDNYGEYSVEKLKILFNSLRIGPTKFLKLSDLDEVEKIVEGSTLIYIKLGNERVKIPKSRLGKINVITHSDILLDHPSLTASIQDSFFESDYLGESPKDVKLEVIKIISSTFYGQNRPLKFKDFNANISSELFDKFLVELTYEGEVLYKYR